MVDGTGVVELQRQWRLSGSGEAEWMKVESVPGPAVKEPAAERGAGVAVRGHGTAKGRGG